jgi:hypothetical protein
MGVEWESISGIRHLAQGRQWQYQLIRLMAMLTLEPRHIGEVLGAIAFWASPWASILQLNDAVERGLPKATLRNVARWPVLPNLARHRFTGV